MSRNKNLVKKRESASWVVRGGGDAMRKTLIALGLIFMLAMPLLAQPFSALVSEVMAGGEAEDGERSAEVTDESENRTCPICGNPMKLCIETSEYKYVCRCGNYVLR